MDPLVAAYRAALAHLASRPDRPVSPQDPEASVAPLESLEWTDEGEGAGAVIEQLSRLAGPATVQTNGGRYFGFVIGGTHPAAMAADWLTSAWDQNASSFATSPASSAIEEKTARWLLEILGLPREASVGFVTGATMASFVGLGAARHALLEEVGWDVGRDGLFGAPPIDVVIGEEAHTSVSAALQFLGLGRERVNRVAADAAGRISLSEVERVVSRSRNPILICAQAGHLNTGAFDDFAALDALRPSERSWLHIDGAFGLWARSSERYRELTEGVQGADSWAVDAHKWLNTPYDGGIAIVRDARAHRHATSITAPYLLVGRTGRRDPSLYTPELSRRARAIPIYAALKCLGRRGVPELVEEKCRQARRFAEELSRLPGVRVVNEVVLNQVLVRFSLPDGSAPDELADAITELTVERLQRGGELWTNAVRWGGRTVMRLSVVSIETSQEDIAASVDAIRRAHLSSLVAFEPGRRPLD